MDHHYVCCMLCTLNGCLRLPSTMDYQVTFARQSSSGVGKVFLGFSSSQNSLLGSQQKCKLHRINVSVFSLLLCFPCCSVYHSRLERMCFW